MNWTTKAVIAKTCSMLPASAWLYMHMQKRFGRLDGDPMSRFPIAADLAKTIIEFLPFRGLRMMEIGTGHVPQVPLAFYLLGAAETSTYDLNRRMEEETSLRSIDFVVSQTDRCAGLLSSSGVSSVEDIARRARALEHHTFAESLNIAGIRYHAPANAAQTGLPSQSVDCVYSVTTFEHIAASPLQEILKETARILTPDGIGIHLIDLSDHFAHTDASISRANFLRYSDWQWQQIAGNSFQYCNRLRAPEYLSLFRQAGLEILRWKPKVDERARLQLEDKVLQPHRQFQHFTQDELATVEVLAVSRPC